MFNRHKESLIHEIRRHNRTAEPAFLDNFDVPTLESYAERLNRLQGKRGRASVWVRPGDTPAITDNEGGGYYSTAW